MNKQKNNGVIASACVLSIALLFITNAQAQSGHPCVSGGDVITQAGRAAATAERGAVRDAQAETNTAVDAATSCIDRIKAAMVLTIPGWSLGDFSGLLKALMDKACQAVVDQARHEAGGYQRSVDDAFRSVGTIPTVGGYPVLNRTTTPVDTNGVGSTGAGSGGANSSGSGTLCRLFGNC